MNRILPLIFLTTLFTSTLSAQIISSIYTDSTTCPDASDGALHVVVEGCFTPIQVINDTDTVVIESLQNPEYFSLHQGGSLQEAEGFGVWGGMTSAGGIFISTGYFSGNILFDSTLLTSNAGSEDIYIAVYDTSGALLWAKSAGGIGSDAGRDVFVADDKIYVSGYVEDSASFDTLMAISGGGFDGFIAKYDLSGNIENIVTVGSTGADDLQSLFVLGNDVYAAGSFEDSLTVGNTSITSQGFSDALVVRFDTLLNGHWAIGGGSSTEMGGNLGGDFVYDMVGDNLFGEIGNLYVTGRYHGGSTANFGATPIPGIGSADIFVAKVDTSGAWNWAIPGGDLGFDEGLGIDISSSNDSLFVVGFYEDNLTLGSSSVISLGGFDGFIQRMDTAGNTGLLTTIGGAGSDACLDIEFIGNGYNAVTGEFTDVLTGQNDSLTSLGGTDAFTIKYDQNNVDVWSKRFGGSGNDRFWAIHKGAVDRLHNTGKFANTAFSAFDSLTSAGSTDVVTTNDDVFGTADTIHFLNKDTGNHTVMIMDNAGNILLDTGYAASSTNLVINGALTPASSGTAMDGAIDITVTGGTPTYSYLWNTNDTTEDLTNLGVGSYTVIVTDSNGCTDSATFVIDTNAFPLVIDTVMLGHVDCFGDSTGFIDVTVSGGNGTVAFQWNTGETTEDLNNIPAGNYTVTISDNDSTYVLNYTINQNPAIVINGSIIYVSSSSAQDGGVNLTVSGGSMPYSYMWSNATMNEDLSNVGIGNYSVTVTDSLGCMQMASFYVDTIPALQLFTAASDVTCENTLNGSIDLTALGGLPPLTFAWSNGANTEDISGLSAGVYTVTVTDSVGQVAIASDSVFSNPTEPDPVVGPFSGPSSAQSWVVYNYNVVPTNGSSFDWTAMGGQVINSAGNAASIQWNAGPDGMIYVEETNQAGCKSMDSLEVTILFVGIKQTAENAIAVYPNPASDWLQIELPQSVDQAMVSLTDLRGNVVSPKARIQSIGQVDVSQLASGIYILSIQVNELTLTHEVVVK